jgi:hypothetical protein
LGGWEFDSWPELGAALDATGTFAEVASEVAAAIRFEVTVKEPKQVSMGSARMSAMLAGETTLDRPPCYTASS